MGVFLILQVEVEKVKGRLQDRLMKRLAAVECKAKEKWQAAEAKKNCEATKTEKQAEQIQEQTMYLNCCHIALAFVLSS